MAGSPDYVRKGNYTYLPPHMRYAMSNPVVGIPVDEMTDEDRLLEDEYRKKAGKPDIIAKNYYTLIKGNPERLERAYKETGTLYKEYIKKNSDDGLEGDRKQVASIKNLIEECKREARFGT